jgi:hypothetical protein
MAHAYCEKVTDITVSDYFDRWDGDMKDPADIVVQALEDTPHYSGSRHYQCSVSHGSQHNVQYGPQHSTRVVVETGQWMACPRGIGLLLVQSLPKTFRDSVLEQPDFKAVSCGVDFEIMGRPCQYRRCWTIGKNGDRQS